jgi:ketosteroid isomerase-like protein
MHMQLPKPIADYFEADRSRDAAGVSACFSENAVVKDEHRTHVGRAAIRQWKANASTEYSYTVEPFALANDGDRTVVTSHVVGTFPGSPIDLRYFFVLDGDSIAELEIVS